MLSHRSVLFAPAALGVFAAWMGLFAGEPAGHALRPESDAALPAPEEWEGETRATDVVVVTEEAGSSCEDVGFFNINRAFSDISRFRGNAFQVKEPNVKLREFKMQLAFSGTTKLWFSVHEKQQNGTWLRRANKDLDYTGNNSAIYYSSGNLAQGGLPLAQDGTYAVGVAWDSTVRVTYARDTTNYGVSHDEMDIGDLLGNVFINNLTPPVAVVVPSFSILADGAHPMQFCYEPVPGACCSAAFVTGPGGNANGCREVLSDACTGPGSFFHGERTTCGSTPCRLGACCGQCGDPAERCSNGFAPEACAAQQGEHLGSGSRCPTEEGDLEAACPRQRGACCRDDRCTPDECEHDCVETGGVYQSDGIGCSPNVCVAACCTAASGCFDLIPEICTVTGGTPREPGSACARLTGSEQCGGACCHTGPGGCTLEDKREDCRAGVYPNAIYKGDGTTCSGTCPNLTTLGACCRANGSCTLTTAAGCPNTPQNDDHFNGPGTLCTVCDDFDRLGACCLPTGACITTSSAECARLEGVHNLEGGDVPQSCTQFGPTNCAADPGCCFGDGTCTRFPVAACTEAGGDSLAAGVACSAQACAALRPLGACCGGAVDSCQVMTELECAALEDRYVGDGTSCVTPAVCPGYGACCRTDGECFDSLTESECNLRNPPPPASATHQYLGAASSCATEGDCDGRGACCTRDDTCLILTEEECDAVEGGFRGPGSLCDEDTCLPGGCCLPDGTCETRTSISCAADKGDFLGQDSDCADEEICKRGACCLLSGTCEIMAGAVCNLREGTFLGADSECNAEVCVRGACCHADGQCENSQIARDCEAMHDVFTGGATCQALEPPCQISCCVLPNDCGRMNAAQCLASEGTLLPGNQLCVTGVCTPGACCGEDGLCADTYDGACPGEFFSNTDCVAQRPCEPHGACCKNGQCQNEVGQSFCEEGGGAFQGDGSNCPGNGCSACCHTDATCDDVLSSRCDTRYGNTRKQGLTCAATQAECVVRGACCQTTTTACEVMTKAACEAITGATYGGDGSQCAEGICLRGACCLDTGTCGEDLSRLACDVSEGEYQGVGVDCEDVNCPRPCEFDILGTQPPNCAVDAGYPYIGEPAPLRPAWDEIKVTFFCAPASPPTPDDFEIRVVPEGPVISITEVELAGAEATLVLSGQIPTAHWVCVKRTLGGDEVCAGALAGDVNADGASDSGDVVALVEYFNEIRPLDDWQCDVNRTDLCTTADIIEAIDLINAVHPSDFDPASSLPVCPTTLFAIFDDPTTAYLTIDVHDVDEEVVWFDPIDRSIIWAADGGEFRFGQFPVNGDRIGAFQVRFGTKNGRRRAYFTEVESATICDLRVTGPTLGILPTQIPVPEE